MGLEIAGNRTVQVYVSIHLSANQIDSVLAATAPH